MSAGDLKGVVHSDAEIMGGTPVFVGTRVPLQNLIDSLEGGESIEDFLDGFPSVKREQVIGDGEGCERWRRGGGGWGDFARRCSGGRSGIRMVSCWKDGHERLTF